MKYLNKITFDGYTHTERERKRDCADAHDRVLSFTLQ